MNNYMICLDGSTESDRAFAWIEGIALNDPSKQIKIFLLNIIDTKPIDKLNLDFDHDKKICAEKGLSVYANRLQLNNIKYETILVETYHSMRETIIEQAEKHNIDMIILGHASKNKLKRVIDGDLRGKIATYLLKHANCPLIIFK
ncbi:hypothetical protein CYY_003875 [Polysphondylium violaceum]|uniref:UspA domain-containing protein n=1 Tax=Polysphondylium violaceum TaxID=133409 RepID=A0A8J4PWA8_9MYCE|nr:hypothetical protein CYY_003875 [Polysphondylium violaceum]